MNFESKEAENISENRKKLLQFERQGNFVFHGSPEVIEKLEPRQAYNRDKETGKMEKDGEPAVFATPYADIAIFRALVNSKNVWGFSESNFNMIDQNELFFSATQNLLDAAKEKIGKVYVLDKQKFSNFKDIECTCFEPIAPIEVVNVTFVDLPQNIQLIKNNKYESK